MNKQQLIISGVGGQGILFITRLLADAAILRGLPVLTSETHGMAQRGGVVISHLKAGAYASPLVRAGEADGLVVMKRENLELHHRFLRPGGWVVVNASRPPELPGTTVLAVDADRLALELKNPQGVNLIILGFLMARTDLLPLFCGADDVERVMAGRLKQKGEMFDAALAAFRCGAAAGGR
jgi:indolepyruvate ferredoxin oxidoreductase beta subunit